MVRIRFQQIQIGTISNSSGVFSGSNQQWGYKHSGKQNQAFGTVDGMRCSVSDIKAALNDRDNIDTLTETPDDS
ncbi:hypothetical protein SD70_07370 [Gordoniibacillus kamchatkensis]|uniref:Uncharacterized protein n=1 Tax=Gordoniibacillus kamchatkensis TaxID=1590651 RepID=A0ABR5AKX6_9BACL|nr:hypothetical protein [Paenibacillus sp. VKM B-2647]KIL41448.1 hypothetical protein SD70_07370 [Paenibacillus sp. VKM B-2647]